VAPASTTASTSPTFTSAPPGADRRQHAGLLGPDSRSISGLSRRRLAGGDGLALRFSQRDARFDDRFTELRNDDVDGHGVLYGTGGGGFASARLTGTFGEGLVGDER
jgi:hypothetical protein